MAQGWICFKCHSPNDLANRFCYVCHAQRPPVAASLDSAEPSAALTEAVAPAPEEAEAQSDMLVGLASLIRQAANGKITPAEFARKMTSAQEGIDQAFNAMKVELQKLSGENEEYSMAVITALEDSQYLFRLALQELQGFGRMKDMARLRIGMLLAEKAEDCYQGVMHGVEEDAKGHNLQGQSDIVRSLAFKVMEGSLALEEYQRAIGEVKQGVNDWLSSGGEKLNAGLEMASRFDGTQFVAVEKVGEMLEQAALDFANIIIAIHTPESVNEAVENIAE